MLSTLPPDILADLTATEPPKGFFVTASRDGYPAVIYKTTGQTPVAVFFTLWLSIWTVACVAMAYQAFFKGPINYQMALMAIPFWAAEVGVIALVLWMFFSVTTFIFYPDRLAIEKTLGKYQRRQEIAKGDVKGIRQVKDGGEGRDSFPSWGLVVATTVPNKILSRQKIEKSAWLGPIVARWAGMEYEPCHKPE